MKKEKLKLNRIVVAMASSVALLCVIDGAIRIFDNPDTGQYIVEEGRFVSAGGKSNSNPSVISGTSIELPTAAIGVADPGCTSKTVTKDDIFKGRLVPYKADSEVISDISENSVNLSQYHNDYYSTFGDNVPLNKDAADDLNKMMEAYNQATGLFDFAVYGTNVTNTDAGSPCPVSFKENANGNVVDLAVIGYGSILPYDGCDTQSWVVKNCKDYGYIVRYPQGKSEITGEAYCPWHLRYVGQPHALIMGTNNMCLEEYVRYVQMHTKDDPIVCNTSNRTYEIYSVPSMGDVTYLSVPLNGNYQISGDGSIGYIITVEK